MIVQTLAIKMGIQDGFKTLALAPAGAILILRTFSFLAIEILNEHL